MTMITAILDFIHDLTWAQIPPDVQHMAARCVLDLSATLVAGQSTELSRIVRDVTATIYGGDEATLLLDGRRVSWFVARHASEELSDGTIDGGG